MQPKYGIVTVYFIMLFNPLYKWHFIFLLPTTSTEFQNMIIPEKLKYMLLIYNTDKKKCGDGSTIDIICNWVRTQNTCAMFSKPRPSSVFTLNISDSTTYLAMTSLSNQVGPLALTPIALGLSIHFLDSDKNRVKKGGKGFILCLTNTQNKKHIWGKYPRYRQNLFPRLKILILYHFL